jgi:hypothetical protein
MIVRVATVALDPSGKPVGLAGCDGCNGKGLGTTWAFDPETGEEFAVETPGVGTDWAEVAQPIVKGAMQIATTRYAVPQLAPGQTIQTATKTGTQLLTQQTPGYPITTGTIQANVSSGTWVLVAAAALGLLGIMFMVKKR